MSEWEHTTEIVKGLTTKISSKADAPIILFNSAKYNALFSIWDKENAIAFCAMNRSFLPLEDIGEFWGEYMQLNNELFARL